MARTAIISPNPASRVWRGRCGPRLRSIRAPRAKCHPPRVSSAAESLVHRRRGAMPVYTVHAPATGNAGIAATDKFVFVRDGFYVWATLLGVVWLAWHRRWRALIGWSVLMTAIDVAMMRLGVSPTAIFLVDALLALLMGFEAASLRRWAWWRRHLRQPGCLVA